MAMAEYDTESASMTVRRVEKGSHLFVVRDYSRWKGIGVAKFIQGEHFAVGGHLWAIMFYPDGMDEDANQNGYASLFISLKSECTEPVRVLFDLYILDQSGGDNNCGYSWFENDDPNRYIPTYIRARTMHGQKNFISRKSLESSVYLKDDCLKISCTVGVVYSHVQNLPIIEVPKPNIRTHFGRLLESKRGADVLFKVDGESFWAHKYILTARAPVFQSCFSDSQQQEKILIPSMEPRIFKAVLQFIYTGTLVEEEQESFGDSHALRNSFIVKMLAAADQFELKGLKKICESRISKRWSGESVAYLFHLAELYHATELKAACLRFAAENKAANVMESNGSKYLEETRPLLFPEMTSHEENLEALEETRPLLFSKMTCHEENLEAQLSTNQGKELGLSQQIWLSAVKGIMWPFHVARQKKMMMEKKIKEL